MPPWFLRHCWADGTQHEAKRFSMMPRPYTRRTGLKGPSDYGLSFIENGQISKGEFILSIFIKCFFRKKFKLQLLTVRVPL